jgi:hypothetical protein
VSSSARRPRVRVFVWKLPMTLELNEFNGREQIGDLIYTPWGTIGFCYNTYGIGCSDRTINLGTQHASEGPNSRASRDSRPGSGLCSIRTPVCRDEGVPAVRDAGLSRGGYPPVPTARPGAPLDGPSPYSVCRSSGVDCDGSAACSEADHDSERRVRPTGARSTCWTPVG